MTNTLHIGLRACLSLAMIALAAGCTHPLDIRGSGEIVATDAERSCTATEAPCEVLVVRDYVETYTAVPAPDSRFIRWEGCGNERSVRCTVRVPADAVRAAWGETAPTLVAVFETSPAGLRAGFRADNAESGTELALDFFAEPEGTGDQSYDATWDFGDGATASGAQVEHRYAQPGRYAVTLSVTDDDGDSHAVTEYVAVSRGPDPLFDRQWHLLNTGQSGNGSSAIPGEDIGVMSAWASCGAMVGCRGEGVVIAVVDDGMEIAHPDLAANVVPGSYNYVDGGSDPTPADPTDSHGTAVAGLVGAVGGNDRGVMGVAPAASLIAYNLISSDFDPSDADDADAATRGDPDVSSNSWGAIDGTGAYSPASRVWRDAIDHGLSEGRGGRGTVYVWAAGNGAPEDVSTKDGQPNYRGVIAVGAVNDQGRASSYTEPGSNILVNAPGGEFCDTQTLVTTDLVGVRGRNPPGPDDDGPDFANRSYTQCFNGTSGATPIVSGVVALVLQANPDLSWRDVRNLLALTARRNDPAHNDWSQNGAGYWINHLYGFGTVDAAAAVIAAPGWEHLGEERRSNHRQVVGAAIPDFDQNGVQVDVDVNSGVDLIEGVDVRVIATHPYNGDIGVRLTNLDTGTTSELVTLVGDPPDEAQEDLDYTFYSARHLDEDASGRWRITVYDQAEDDVGTLESVALTFYGRGQDND